VLMAAMVPFRDGPDAVDLTGKRVAVVNGRRDPMATATQTATLLAQLREKGAEVTEIPHPGGHTIDPQMLPDIREFITHGGTDAAP
ncbi:MAG: hypothetical protein ABI251_02975, partial [Mycobacteriaceae bacterium]